MWGLGLVAPNATTGVPAPDDPLSVTLNSIVCNVSGNSGTIQPVDVTFAGLAPGQIGIYQINLRLPSTFESPVAYADHGYLRFGCGLTGAAVPSESDAIFVR